MAERVEITVVVDNNIDIFLPASRVATYPVAGAGSTLLAEQGLSLWIDVESGGKVASLLYDFGRSAKVCPHNLAVLGLDLARADFLVLSHGHVDHCGSLRRVLKMTRDDCRLFVHPEALGQKRYVRLGDGRLVGPWEIRRSAIAPYGDRVVYTAGPFQVLPDVFVSGEIERRTDFEKGMPNAFLKRGDSLVHDDIREDQALFIDLDGRGLVVVTGCCHAGLVNTLLKAASLFPGKRVHAVVGGFHLNGAPERQMDETIRCLDDLGVSYIAPLHCTGHDAKRTLAGRLKGREIPGTTGARIAFLANRAG